MFREVLVKALCLSMQGVAVHACTCVSGKHLGIWQQHKLHTLLSVGNLQGL